MCPTAFERQAPPRCPQRTWPSAPLPGRASVVEQERQAVQRPAVSLTPSAGGQRGLEPLPCVLLRCAVVYSPQVLERKSNVKSTATRFIPLSPFSTRTGLSNRVAAKA